jgi:hypothetical protein
MGWLIALAAIVLIGLIPVGVSAKYDEDGAAAQVIIGPLRLRVYPGKGKKQPQKKEEKPEEELAQKTGAPAKKKKGGSLSDFMPLVRIVLDFLADFRRKLRVDILQLHLVLAGGDPADLGENYGKACAALGNLWPRLEEIFIIRRRDIKVQCDFESSETRITARMDISVTLARLFSFGFRYGFRGLREFLKITNKRKGGAAI